MQPTDGTAGTRPKQGLLPIGHRTAGRDEGLLVVYAEEEIDHEFFLNTDYKDYMDFLTTN